MKKNVYQREYLAKKRQTLFIKILVITGGFVAGTVFLLYALFFARWFDIRTVHVNAPFSIPEEEVLNSTNQWLDVRTFGLAHRSNSIFVSPNKLESLLAKSFPQIETVRVDRISVHEIAIHITVRKAIAIWCLSMKRVCYYFDENGIAFEELEPTEGFLFTAINDERNRTIELGSTVAPDDWREDIITVKRVAQFGAVTLTGFTIPNDSFDEFRATTQEGWWIKFSMQTNVGQQMRNLLAFLKEKIKPEERTTLEYVDLTIPDRIYYK